MARHEIQCERWYQSSGRDLLPPSSCAGFRILSPTSVQNLGSRDPRFTMLALYQALRSCVTPMHENGCFAQDMIKPSLGPCNALLGLYNKMNL